MDSPAPDDRQLGRYRLDFLRTFPAGTTPAWPAVEAWIELYVSPAYQVGLRRWVESRIGARLLSKAATRRKSYPLIERLHEFELYRVIDAGGMGVVYEAYDSLLDRTVAIKRPRQDVRLELATRFEVEARLTAGHPHPGIPPVYRSGVDASDYPYMAMLYVEGETLADRFAKGRVSSDDLLDVILRVSQVIGSRHTESMIHRDLKPSNVKLGRNGEVFVLDWGLSREWAGADASELPALASSSGTLAYMAPEQFSGVVTPRTDVFQIGGMLCELLTGQPPYPGCGGAEEQREVALEATHKRLHAVADSGRQALAELALRCLSADPQGRPEHGAALAHEIMNLRAQAAENGRLAEVAKYEAEVAKREARAARIKYVGMAASTAILLVGCVGTFLQWRRAETALKEVRQAIGQKNAALERLGQEIVAKEAAHRRAETETAAKLEALEAAGKLRSHALRVYETMDLMIGDLALQPSAEMDVPLPAALAERLDRVVERVSAEYIGDEYALALLKSRIAKSYRALGNPFRAIDLQGQAWEVLRRICGEYHTATIIARIDLALAYSAAGYYAKAIEALEQTRPVVDRAWGTDDPLYLVVSGQLANAYRAGGRIGDAVRLHRETVDLAVRTKGRDDATTLDATVNLATALEAAGQIDEAIRLLRVVYDARLRVLGDEHADTLRTKSVLASAQLSAGQITEAVSAYEHVRAVQISKLGPSHFATLVTQNNLATAYLAAGRTPEAADLFRHVLGAYTLILGAESPLTLTAKNNLANAYRVTGRAAEAVVYLEEILETQHRLKRNMLHILTTEQNLALAYQDVGRTPDAVGVLETVLAARRRALGPTHPHTLSTAAALANSYYAVGKSKEKQALALLEEVLATRNQGLGPFHPDTITTLTSVAGIHLESRRGGVTIRLLEPIQEHLVRTLSPTHPVTLNAQSTLAGAYLAEKRPREAVRLFESVRDGRMRVYGNLHPLTLTALQNLGGAYRAAGRFGDAIRLLEDLRTVRAANPALDQKESLLLLNELAVAYLHTDRLNEAIPLLEAARGGLKELLGPEHSDTQACDATLRLALLAAGQYGRLADLIDERVAYLRRQTPRDELEILSELMRLGEFRLRGGEPVRAETALREFLAVRSKRFPDEWQTHHTRALLGRSLLAQAKFVEAEPLLVAAYRGLKAQERHLRPSYRWTLPETAAALIDLYSVLGDARKAAEWRTERAVYRPDLAPPPRLIRDR